MQRLKKLFYSILIIAVLASCSTNPIKPLLPNFTTAPGKAAQETQPSEIYIIQPGDMLGISVWKEKDLQLEVAVRPDGGLNFPLVGEIVAAGKTIDQLKKDIASRLAKYVPDPVVTVMVTHSSGNKIYVIGKVNRPGEFVANRNMDVMQALTMAGGPNPYAAVNKIKILRRVNGEEKVFLFKYSHVEKGEDHYPAGRRCSRCAVGWHRV